MYILSPIISTLFLPVSGLIITYFGVTLSLILIILLTLSSCLPLIFMKINEFSFGKLTRCLLQVKTEFVSSVGIVWSNLLIRKLIVIGIIINLAIASFPLTLASIYLLQLNNPTLYSLSLTSTSLGIIIGSFVYNVLNLPRVSKYILGISLISISIVKSIWMI